MGSAGVRRVVAAIVLWFVAPLQAAELKLTLDWNRVITSRDFPVTGGVPFARGALKDPQGVALRIGDQIVPLQIQQLAMWPDGSVKWLLLDFQATPAATSATLIYNDNVPLPAAIRTPVRVTQTDSAITVNTGAVAFSVRSNGFIDQITFGQRPILRSVLGPTGTGMSLVCAGDGSIDSLFRNDRPIHLAPKMEAIREEAGITRVDGRYTLDQHSVPFTRSFKRANATTIEVTEEIDFRNLDPTYLVAGHQIVLPIQTHEDDHQRMLAFAGTHRVELFRMNMNDVSRRGMNISDNRGFIPYWDIGGVLQLPTGYTVWKANHADTMAYPVEEGITAPGWADYSEEDWGLSIRMLDAQAAAPWAMTIDARAGAFSISSHPSSQPARSGSELGVRTIRFQMVLHETSWPAFYPCKLDQKTYEELLRYL